MPRSKYPIVAPEGVPLLLLNGLAFVPAVHWFGWFGVVPPLITLIALVFLFRDPYREVPAAPRAVLSPCDGTVVSIEPTTEGVLRREAIRIVIRVDNFGAYTARSPIEGKVLDPRDNVAAGSRLLGVNGLWVRSDENDDVVTLFRGPPLLGAPAAFVRYGERIGQGQRFAYLRLSRHAEMFVPANVRIKVEPGERVVAGYTPIARLLTE